MDANFLIDIVDGLRGEVWVDKVKVAHETGRLAEWMSTFHPSRLPCQLEGSWHHGAFNAGLKFVFSDSTAWLLRFVRVGRVHDDYADEKVAMEVQTLRLIRQRTTIPVPEVQAWGAASDNPLGLGPFIIMDFIQGVSLSDIFNDSAAERPTGLIREDVGDGDVEIVYWQLANFFLQIFELNFDRIGSLPSPDPGNPVPTRPLTFKTHTILQDGGVNTFGDRRKGFETTAEYFQHLADQDLEQLVRQPNSCEGFYTAKSKYVDFKILKSVAGDLINKKYDHGNFKLICDDLGLANLIVKSKDDLTVVGVVDLEWSYTGPAQLFGSASWWLLQDRPINMEWDYVDGEPPKLSARYFKYLDMYQRILEEEEARMHPDRSDWELSNLVKWSRESGAMWLHMLLSASFNDPDSFPWSKLREHLGEDEWTKRGEEFGDEEELEAFGVRKVREEEEYDAALEELEKDKELVDKGEMTREEFIAKYSPTPKY